MENVASEVVRVRAGMGLKPERHHWHQAPLDDFIFIQLQRKNNDANDIRGTKIIGTIVLPEKMSENETIKFYHQK